MSNSSRSEPARVRDALPSGHSGRLLRRTVTGLAFWTAVALPFLHLPLLVSGLETTRMTIAFLVLLGLNVVALILGHPYGRD